MVIKFTQILVKDYLILNSPAPAQSIEHAVKFKYLQDREKGKFKQFNLGERGGEGGRGWVESERRI